MQMVWQALEGILSVGATFVTCQAMLYVCQDVALEALQVLRECDLFQRTPESTAADPAYAAVDHHRRLRPLVQELRERFLPAIWKTKIQPKARANLKVRLASNSGCHKRSHLSHEGS